MVVIPSGPTTPPPALVVVAALPVPVVEAEGVVVGAAPARVAVEEVTVEDE